MAPLSDDDAATLATRPDGAIGAIGAIGEWSIFYQTHVYYVQGVGRDTAVLPEGWEDRLVAVSGPNTNGGTGLCLDAHDLCLATLVEHRQKDLAFVRALIEAGLISAAAPPRRRPRRTSRGNVQRRPRQQSKHPAIALSITPGLISGRPRWRSSAQRYDER